MKNKDVAKKLKSGSKAKATKQALDDKSLISATGGEFSEEAKRRMQEAIEKGEFIR